jgi:hypothetical protein
LAAKSVMPRLTPLLTDWAELQSTDGQPYADALLRACEPLDDEARRALPGTPDDAAVAIVDQPFGDGVYLPWAWLESFSASLGLPVAELENGWDVSDGDDIYFCPRVDLADDPDSPDDTRPFVRVDEVRRWKN